LLVLNSELSKEAIDFTKILFFFLCGSRVAPRELLRSSTKDPDSGRESYILGEIFLYFSKISKPKKLYPKNKIKLWIKR